MVKYVVDVERGLIAIGGEMHVDGEQLLLESGSRQADLWGANYYPGRGTEGCIEYTSLINIRPSAGNRAMELLDPASAPRSVRSRSPSSARASCSDGRPSTPGSPPSAGRDIRAPSRS